MTKMNGMEARLRRESQEGGDICIPIADSYCCTTEAKTTLKSNYPPIKRKISWTNINRFYYVVFQTNGKSKI